MKLGPLTFQWACLVWVCRSMASARRALSSSTALPRIVSDRSFFVLNISGLLVEAFERDLMQNQRLSNLSITKLRPGPTQSDPCPGFDTVGRPDKVYAASLLCLKNANKSALICSACVVHIPCGKHG